MKLPDEKREKILQVICEEFTYHSYADASTNRIVEKAGISKGTLFNYFGSKEALYHDSFRYVIDHLKQFAITEFPTDDFIERCYLLAEKDIKIYQEAPYMLDLVATIYSANPSNIPEDVIESIGVLLAEAMERLYTGVDYSLFRKDLDATVLMKMIRFTFDGYLQEVLAQVKVGGLTTLNFAECMTEYQVFLEEAKKVYYSVAGS